MLLSALVELCLKLFASRMKKSEFLVREVTRLKEEKNTVNCIGHPSHIAKGRNIYYLVYLVPVQPMVTQK